MGYNILVVDDNRIMREMVVKSVRLSPLEVGEVHQAANGEEALAKLAEHLIDLVLLDINMPVMNGEQFLEKLRSDVLIKFTPVLVVSTESSQPRIQRLKAMGAAFIHKPFRPEELVGAVATLIAKPRGVQP